LSLRTGLTVLFVSALMLYFSNKLYCISHKQVIMCNTSHKKAFKGLLYKIGSAYRSWISPIVVYDYVASPRDIDRISNNLVIEYHAGSTEC
jgi:hypothetical protein